MNVAEIKKSTDSKSYVKIQALPNNDILGKKLKKSFNKEFRNKIEALTEEGFLIKL